MLSIESQEAIINDAAAHFCLPIFNALKVQIRLVFMNKIANTLDTRLVSPFLAYR